MKINVQTVLTYVAVAGLVVAIISIPRWEDTLLGNLLGGTTAPADSTTGHSEEPQQEQVEYAALTENLNEYVRAKHGNCPELVKDAILEEVNPAAVVFSHKGGNLPFRVGTILDYLEDVCLTDQVEKVAIKAVSKDNTGKINRLDIVETLSSNQ